MSEQNEGLSMIVPVMAISNLVLTRQIYSEETNGAHAHYREPVKETSLKASNGERFKTLNSLLIISSCLFEIESPTRKIPFSARFRKYTDLSPTQINLLFHKITFDKSFPFKSFIFKLYYLPQSTLQKILSILHKRLAI